MINLVISKDAQQTKQYFKLLITKKAIAPSEILTLDYTSQPDIEAYIKQIDLFCQTKLFIIHGANFLVTVDDFKKQKSLFNIINEFVDSEIIICFVIEKKPLANVDFVALTKGWQVNTLKEIDNNEKIKIVNELLKNNEMFLSKDVYNYLIQSIDCCYGNIFNEIEKLTNLMKSKCTTEEQMEIISNYNQENIFHLFEALLMCNHERVWQIHNDLVSHHEDEISIINALASQANNLYYILKLLKQHCPITTISKLTGVSIYFINLYKTKFINYNIDNINKFLLSLYKLEVNIKLSKIDKNLGFKQFLLRMSHLGG